MVVCTALGASLIAPPGRARRRAEVADPGAGARRSRVRSPRAPGRSSCRAPASTSRSVGYEQAEYFISGTASSYRSASPLTDDGNWSVAPDASAPYKTRIVVYRPIDPQRFNGTVMVEWLNVSGGLDSGANWTTTHVEQIREGMAWVGVTAQKRRDRRRLEHAGRVPGAQDTRTPCGTAPLEPSGRRSSPTTSTRRPAGRSAPGPGDRARGSDAEARDRGRRVAVRRSTSPATSNGSAAPDERLFDGFLVHGRDGGAALFDGIHASQRPRSSVRIRTRPRRPGADFTTESRPRASPLRRRAAARLRASSATWEVAGTSHYDTYSLSFGTQGRRQTARATPRSSRR